ncbi:MAG: 2-succinyl-5-enolpyruvyl-6-hydroxy-3-cyclohexene-1-carboxylic-acid synthase [Gammaproteobacteria bacterium]|nr:2-succinyl-5-enolpyruvyl-6-hydroxy-3-cyclohexene-1-carboxylic-acid synthase [Gammaproteobacteria bacterium]
MTAATAALNGRWAALVIEELVRLGVRHVCIAPGSRSTPLTLAAAGHPALACTVHFDERALAFHALGLARGSGRAVVVICTSGSAVANLYPAVVEAAMDGVPLVLLTADRPPELRDTGANQAIDQVGLFGGHARMSVDLPVPAEDYPAEALLTTLDQALYRCRHPLPGPVQINVPFREPLIAPGASPSPPSPTPTLWPASDKPYTEYPPPRHALAPDALGALRAALDGIERGLLVIGRLRDDSERAAAERLAGWLGWPVCADITSGVRASRVPAPWLRHYDLLLGADPEALERPDGILHLGGELVSKRLLGRMDAWRVPLVRVVDDPRRLDPAHRVRLRLQVSLAALAEALVPAAAGAPSAGARPPAPPAGAASAWRDRLLAADADLAAAVARALDGAGELDEPTVCRLVSRGLPEDAVLCLAASMPVRDMDMFAAADGACVPVYSNRGASGIDGTLATACGVAAGSGRRVVLVCGDLAFLHDLNALALLARQRPAVTVVLLNNDGGGIFSFLPVADIGEPFEAYFGTPHGLPLGDLARGFGLACHAPATRAAFREALAEALASGAPSVIEVRSDRAANLRRHRELLADFTAALGSDAAPGA